MIQCIDKQRNINVLKLEDLPFPYSLAPGCNFEVSTIKLATKNYLS